MRTTTLQEEIKRLGAGEQNDGWRTTLRPRLAWALPLLLLLALAVWRLLVDAGPIGFSPWPDQTWRAMQERGAWRIGMDPSFPPFETLDAAGSPAGFDVDLARQVAAEWGLQVEIVAIGFDSLYDALKAGKIDSIVSAFPFDPRLTKDVAFSPPYFEAGILLAVRPSLPISGVAQLAGRTVAVEWGSMGDMVGRRLQREGVEVRLAPYVAPDEVIRALAEDEGVDALLLDAVSLREAQGRGADLVAVGPALESNPYVIVSPLRAVTLHKEIAAALAELERNGTIAELEERWFGAQPPAGSRVQAAP